jgi:TolB-like protein
MSLIQELKRRNVFRVGIAYAVAAWLLLQLTDVLSELLELPGTLGKTVVALLLIGFPVALIFAWAFELTPEGVKREQDVDRNQSITPQTGKKLDRAIIVGLAAVIVIMGVERLWFAGQQSTLTAPAQQVAAEAPEVEAATDPSPAEEGAGQSMQEQQSVAVLPFTAMSSGEDDEYFADGLTEEILNSLAGLPELLVTARTSSFHFKGKDLPIPEIARTLGVDHVVEGSVRRAGERVRITAQLIRAEDGFHLWSDTYDRTLEDIFAVQEDIAENIAETLDVVLDEGKRERMRDAGIGDVEAFIAFQKGVEAFVAAHNEIEEGSTELASAVGYFDQALAVAPDLVAARIMKADQRGHLILELASGLRKEAYDGELEATLNDLREEYRLAIEASPPGNQRDILQLEATLFSDDWSDLQLLLERALAPGGCATMNWSSDLFRFFGYAEQAIPKMREILRCDPLNFVGLFGLTGALLATGGAEEAVTATKAVLDQGIPFAVLEQINYITLLAAGHLQAPEAKGPGSAKALYLFDRQLPRQLLLGNREAALELAEEYRNGPLANDWTSMIVAAMLGDRERANRHAALLDAKPGSAVVLINASYPCACGATFDLDATPNLKKRIEESGLTWSPAAAIRFPDKDW